MITVLQSEAAWARTPRLAVRGLWSWTARQALIAVLAAVAFGLLLGVVTVLIPNSFFARDIPPVWWNYPVWVLTSAFCGMLVATYVRGGPVAAGGAGHGDAAEAQETSPSAPETPADREERRTSRLGLAGSVLAWFAVGCPVCNKIALLALGYSGAITWFAPVQPFLALGALLLTGIALVARLRGQVACPVPARIPEAVR